MLRSPPLPVMRPKAPLRGSELGLPPLAAPRFGWFGKSELQVMRFGDGDHLERGGVLVWNCATPVNCQLPKTLPATDVLRRTPARKAVLVGNGPGGGFTVASLLKKGRFSRPTGRAVSFRAVRLYER